MTKIEIKKLTGLLVTISFICTLILAIIAYKNYNFFGQYLSELGAGETSVIFNVGLMITSLLMVCLYILIYYKESKSNLVIGVVSAVSLFGVGLFPLTLKNPHYLSALLFFLLSFFLIAKSNINLYFKEKNIDWIGVISIVVILFYIIIFRNPLMQKFSVFVIIVWLIWKVFFNKK